MEFSTPTPKSHFCPIKLWTHCGWGTSLLFLRQTAVLNCCNQGNQGCSPPVRSVSSFFYFHVTPAKPSLTKPVMGKFIEFCACNFLNARLFQENRTKSHPRAATMSLLLEPDAVRDTSGQSSRKEQQPALLLAAPGAPEQAWASCRAAYICTEAGGLLDLASCISLGFCQDFQNISMSKQERSGFTAVTKGGRFWNRKLPGRSILALTHSVSSSWMPAKHLRFLQGDPSNGWLISHLPLASVSKAHCTRIMTVCVYMV